MSAKNKYTDDDDDSVMAKQSEWVSEWVGFNVPPDTVGYRSFRDGLSRKNSTYGETKFTIDVS